MDMASGTTQRRGWARVCRGAVPSGAAAARGQSRDAQLAARTPQSPPADDHQAIFGQDALHAARHSHHAPTTNVNRFLCLLCLFHCLDFLHCFIPLRDPALEQALFVHCPFRPILTTDAPPNYPTTHVPSLVYPRARLSSLQSSRGFPSPTFRGLALRALLALSTWHPGPTTTRLLNLAVPSILCDPLKPSALDMDTRMPFPLVSGPTAVVRPVTVSIPIPRLYRRA
jgi:hypothetical protein